MAAKRISKHPYRELAAPGLPDDFYLNLLSWSARDIVAAATGSTVTLWGPERTPRHFVLKQEGERRAEVTHLSFCPQEASLLLLGFRDGETALFDVNQGCKVRSLAGHRSRCAVAAWGRGGRSLVATGSRDHSVLYRDVRSPEPFVLAFLRHQSEVCGIDSSSSERLLASGGNDNLLCVWDVRRAALPKPWAVSASAEGPSAAVVYEGLGFADGASVGGRPLFGARLAGRSAFSGEELLSTAAQFLRRPPQLGLSHLSVWTQSDLGSAEAFAFRGDLPSATRVRRAVEEELREFNSEAAATEDAALSSFFASPSASASRAFASQESPPPSTQTNVNSQEGLLESLEFQGPSQTPQTPAAPAETRAGWIFRPTAAAVPPAPAARASPRPSTGSHTTQPLFVYEEHCAAVKAVRFCCHSDGLLASGGGTADRQIRFWNTNLGMANSVYGFDSGCQVCNICFSRHSHEFVSTHGFSLNQIFVWNYKPFALTATPPEKTRGVPGSAGGYPLIDALVNLPDDDAPEEDASENLVEKTATLSGHSARVLFFSESPCGTRIVTGAGRGDELLKFWEIFPNKPSFPSGIAQDGE